MLDIRRLISQLHGLERRTARGGKDSIDHGPGAHDDIANAVAGAIVLASAYVRPAVTAMTGTYGFTSYAPRGVDLRANMAPPQDWLDSGKKETAA